MISIAVFNAEYDFIIENYIFPFLGVPIFAKIGQNWHLLISDRKKGGFLPNATRMSF